MRLPEGKSWSVDDQREAWWTARHSASRSELSLRTWRASRLSTRQECMKQIRLWRPHAPDPDGAPESVVERRRLEAPAGFEVELDVGVRRTGENGEMEGYALAVGHGIGRCYAAIYSTVAVGARAEDVVAARLALVTERVLPRVDLLGVEDRVR
jgi:hypothetical protein